MNPFIRDPRHIVLAFVYAVFAILACLYLTSCETIPYRVSLNYGGATASYDGKRVLLDVDGNEVGRSLRGYAK